MDLSKPVKLTVSLYLILVALITCGYLIMILVGSFQGNDMRGAVLDTDNTRHIENVDETNNTTKSSEPSTSSTQENRSTPKHLQSKHIGQPTINQYKTIKTWSLDNDASKNHV
ncbi:hypothetical protein NYT90_15865 [Staphylococcus aureus]|uniref:hypothetical protein n=1 Tax=Staphylococcus aureus TaxID=1280 RepID=UPI0021757395|nr:hypothetical protein [Staphylococcus aureus]MCS5431551.1 hypothetical protein [Staphylococcus aureus]